MVLELHANSIICPTMPKKHLEPLNLKLEEVGCPICLEILIEPITMPCKHTLCKPCFTKNLEVTSLNCPFCKTRVGTWHRRAKSVDNLIDLRLWNYLQQNFGEKVADRLRAEAGEVGVESEDYVDESLFAQTWFTHNLVESGQIGQEFKSQLKELESEDMIRKQKDELKSQALIRKIQQQDKLKTDQSDSQTEEVTTQDLLENADDYGNDPEISDVLETPGGDANFFKPPSQLGSSSSLDSEFLQNQKLIEERLAQQRRDEEFAKRLQQEEEILSRSPAAQTRRSPRRGKENKHSDSSKKAQVGRGSSSQGITKFMALVSSPKPRSQSDRNASGGSAGPSCDQRVTPCDRKVTSSDSSVTSCDSQVTSSGIDVTSCDSPVTSSGSRMTQALSDSKAEYYRLQKLEEEKIAMSRGDEELAKRLQAQENHMSSNTDTITPKRPRGPRQLTMEELFLETPKRRKMES